MGLLNPRRDKNRRQEPGGRRDDTCDHRLSRSWKVDVCEKEKRKRAIMEAIMQPKRTSARGYMIRSMRVVMDNRMRPPLLCRNMSQYKRHPAAAGKETHQHGFNGQGLGEIRCGLERLNRHPCRQKTEHTAYRSRDRLHSQRKQISLVRCFSTSCHS